MMPRDVTDSEVLVAVLAEEAGATIGAHLDPEQLLAYHSETLPPETEKRVRDHLVGCRSCSEALLDLADLHRSGMQSPEGVADLPTIAAWRDFETRIASSVEGVAEEPKPAPWSSRRAVYALAASLLLGIVGLSMWVAQLHEANAGLRQTVEELSAIQVDPQILYLEEVTRGEGNGKVVEVSAARPTFLVVAIPQTTRTFEAFEAELSTDGGEVIWREECPLSEAGTLRFVLSRHWLDAGDYRVRIFGIEGEHREVVNDEVLHLRNR